MNNFSLNAAFVIDTINDELLLMINVRITRSDGNFVSRAMGEHVHITDRNVTVQPFNTRISGNRKEINASFTTDAFIVFSGLVNVEFGYESEVLGVFENFDPNDIDPLDPIFAGIPVTTADNAWLQDQISA